MKKLLKVILSLSLFFSLIACQKEEPYTGPQIKLTLFYAEGCPNCQNFMDEAIPLLIEEFGDYISISYFETSSTSNIIKYREIADRLIGFDDLSYQECYIPFIVFEGLFAKVGYDSGSASYYIKDIKRALAGKPLDSFLDATKDRYLFKES